MDRARVNSREASEAGWAGVREEAQVPARGARSAPPRAAHDAAVRPRASWLRVAVRMVLDAAIAVGLMTMVPIGIAATGGDSAWQSAVRSNNTQVREEQAERSRSLVLPRDPSITPMQAGLAFNTLQPVHEASAHFPAVDVPTHREATWGEVPDGPDMFPTARPNNFVNQGLYGSKETRSGEPASGAILEAAAKGFTPREMAFLRTIATSPVWRDFDVIARAPAVDFIGGRLKIPFSPDAKLSELPLPRYASIRHLASASVSRAAYHLALGQRDSAEAALRSIVSFGFALIDNGTTLIDEMIGTVIVGTGRESLRHFYTITGDPRATSAAVAPSPSASQMLEIAGKATASTPPQDPRDVLIARAANPALPRAERFESLGLLSMSSCGSVKDLLLGPRADVGEAYARARRELARYPSERAMVDLAEGTMERRLPSFGPYGPISSVAISAATVAGTVLNNPRMAACTRAAIGWRAGL